MKITNFGIQWKQNLRKIPDGILIKIKDFPKKDVVVACVKKIPISDIASGKYSHLDIKIEKNNPVFPSSLVPNQLVGKYSYINVNGEEIVRRDLPMISKPFTWETPNYGDSWRGYHDVTVYRDVYQRDFIAPKLLELKVELVGEEVKTDRFFVFKFQVDEVLDKTSKNFKNNLFSNLNLLQENAGVLDVFPSNATRDDYLKTIYVQWEILPPGEKDSTITKILSGFKAPTPEIKEKLLARYDLLSKLNPIAYVKGTSGFRRYFGAQFSDNLVVFENLEYGNAIYVMFEEWKTLSQLSRIELLSSKRKGFERIIHNKGWQSQLKYLIKGKSKGA
ncbi:MAG: hypothetical protein V1709_04260 [Planctomycetota bacterium]